MSSDPYRQGAPQPAFPPPPVPFVPPAGQGFPMPPAPAYGQPPMPGYGPPAPVMPPLPGGYPAQAMPPMPSMPPMPQPVAGYGQFGQPQFVQPVAYQAPQHAAPAQPTLPTAPLPLSARTTVQPAAPMQPQPVPLPAQRAPAPAVPRPMPAPAHRPLPAPAPGRGPAAQPAGNRPLPVGAARPVPVDASKRSPETAVDKDAADEEAKDPTDKAVKAAPPWLVSMVVHMLLMIVAAFIYFTQPAPNQIFLDVVYAEELGEQVLEDTLQSPESLNMEIETPVLSFDVKPADDPLAAPPILDLVQIDATSAVDNIQAPSIGMALTGREAGAKKALLAAYGGNATTEAAVRAGLEWLAKQQMKDGGWSLTGPYPDGAGLENRLSATAMALLAFQGAGHTHQSGDFKKVVQGGWDYLLKLQNADGYFEHEAAHHHRMYAQAQASIAICEIYGMTKDEKFKKPAQLALDFTHKSQSPEGGWRYEPRIDADVSVTGWYVMALQSGLMAGLEVQSPALDSISRFLDKCAHQNGAHYSYKPGMSETLTMTAEGLLCRQYLGWKHEDERMHRGIEYVLGNPVDYNDQNVYYWYYATQACHHMDGDHWNRWNQVMRQAVPTAQVKTGAEKGSWNSSGDRWGAHGGRLYVTCLSIYMLEVYYRHLPIYKWRLQ